MKRARQGGFTLIELVVALAILGVMMLLLYSGLQFAIRSWDAGDAVGRTAADRRIGEAFMRRELGELFPMRWKDPTRLRFAFEGARDHMRFVSSRPAGVSIGGLSLVSLEAAGNARAGDRSLVMRRALPDDAAENFDPLDAAEPSVVLAGVESVSFQYFGAENDFTDPQWVDEWTWPTRIPLMVRIRVKRVDGSMLPDMIVRIMLGEEAGCLESSYQRLCRPRRTGA
jgi:general secretion pathway protein J